jgi:hypothetical protein
MVNTFFLSSDRRDSVVRQALFPAAVIVDEPIAALMQDQRRQIALP